MDRLIKNITNTAKAAAEAAARAAKAAGSAGVSVDSKKEDVKESKTVIRLTESDLHEIVKESVNRIISGIKKENKKEVGK